MPKENRVTVTVATPGNNDISGGINASGQVEAIQSANISTRVMGYITKVYVKIGDQVKQGQLLFTVNSTDILAKRAQTDAATNVTINKSDNLLVCIFIIFIFLF